MISSGETWSGFSSLSSAGVDELIEACDIGAEINEVFELTKTPFSVFHKSSPSNVSGHDEKNEDLSLNISATNISIHLHTNDEPTTAPDEIDSAFPFSFFKTPKAENRLESHETYLFHYYLNNVVPLLTPIHNLQNPWLRYPAIALHQSFTGGQKHLLHSMMALSATLLSNTDCHRQQMSALGVKLYTMAMAELRGRIQDGSVDYLGLLTTILTFLFIEVCSVHAGYSALLTHLRSSCFKEIPKLGGAI